MKNIAELPTSDDEYWEDAEKYNYPPVKVPICRTHGKNWLKHTEYLDNHDGTISCKKCPWGGQLPGYMRVLDGKIVDLRKL